MSISRHELGFALLTVTALPAIAQSSRREFRPEFDLYISYDERTRFVFKNTFDDGPAEGYAQGTTSASIEIALRPVFRRALRQNPNVFRDRYLTFRTGYEYSAGSNQGTSTGENRIIAEVNTRYPLPLGIVLRDRNRGDFRFRHGQPFSTRYRNRLWVEHDLEIAGKVAATPYVYDEITYDGRFGAWSSNRVAMGVELPVSKFVIEPYLLRQHNTRSSPTWVNALGLKISLFL